MYVARYFKNLIRSEESSDQGICPKAAQINFKRSALGKSLAEQPNQDDSVEFVVFTDEGGCFPRE